MKGQRRLLDDFKGERDGVTIEDLAQTRARHFFIPDVPQDGRVQQMRTAGRDSQLLCKNRRARFWMPNTYIVAAFGRAKGRAAASKMFSFQASRADQLRAITLGFSERARLSA